MGTATKRTALVLRELHDRVSEVREFLSADPPNVDGARSILDQVQVHLGGVISGLEMAGE